MDKDYDHPMTPDEIMKCGRAIAKYLTICPDNAIGKEDYCMIAALAIWKNGAAISACTESQFNYAYTIGKYAIYREYRKAKLLKRRGHWSGARLGAPGEMDGERSDGTLTPEEIRNALADQNNHWMNDLTVRDELTTILINEEFKPSEARIIEGFLRGLSPSDLANEFGINVSAVTKPLITAIKRMRKRLGISLDLPINLPREMSAQRVINSNPQKNKSYWVEKPVMLGGIEGGISDRFDELAATLSKLDKSAKEREAASIKARAAKIFKRYGGRQTSHKISRRRPFQLNDNSHYLQNMGRGVK